jgi:hypothetical protein
MDRALVVPFPFNLHGMILRMVHLTPIKHSFEMYLTARALFD